MLPTAPYLLVGFTVAPGTPNGQQILDDVEHNMPLPQRGIPIALPIPDVYLIECPRNDPDTPFQDIADYLSREQTRTGGALIWAMQLCRSNEIAGL